MVILKPEARRAPRNCRSLEHRREARGAKFKMVRTVVMSSVFTTWPHRRLLSGRDVLEFLLVLAGRRLTGFAFCVLTGSLFLRVD